MDGWIGGKEKANEMKGGKGNNNNKNNNNN
jgi:hypothetical protein